MSRLRTAQNLLYYIGSLCSGGFAERLQACVGSVCGGGTALMCRGRGVHGWVRQLDASPSTRRWSVEVYVSQGPHQGATVVFGYIEGSFLVSRTGDARERYAPNIYRCIRT